MASPERCLTEENHRGLLARARHGSKREIERLVAEIAPKPDAPSRVVALPSPVAPADPEVVRAQEVHAPERVAPPSPSPSPSEPTPTPIPIPIPTPARRAAVKEIEKKLGAS